MVDQLDNNKFERKRKLRPEVDGFGLPLVTIPVRICARILNRPQVALWSWPCLDAVFRNHEMFYERRAQLWNNADIQFEEVSVEWPMVESETWNAASANAEGLQLTMT